MPKHEKSIKSVRDLAQLTDLDILSMRDTDRENLEIEITSLWRKQMLFSNYFSDRSITRFESLLIADFLSGYKGFSSQQDNIYYQEKLAKAYVAWFEATNHQQMHDAYHVEVLRAIYHRPKLYKDKSFYIYVAKEYPERRFVSQYVMDVIKYYVTDPLAAFARSLVNSFVVVDMKHAAQPQSSAQLRKTRYQSSKPVRKPVVSKRDRRGPSRKYG